MNLLVVESPGKIATIEQYLGKDFKVIATIGHIRDLKKSGKGFNTEDFSPVWEWKAKDKTDPGGRKKSEEIKELSSKAEHIYIATDPDREGEAISWHVFDVIDKKYHNKCKRITFNEITKDAILEAIKNPRDIDMNQVHAQWARRILDRFLGYDLSKLAQMKTGGESAGRVQSACLGLIIERAKKIEDFVPEPWWTVNIELATKATKECKIFLRTEDIENNINVFPGIKMKQMPSANSYCFGSEADAIQIAEKLKQIGDEYELYSIEPEKQKKRITKKPFTTDSLMTKAYYQFKWSSKTSQSIVNNLYQSGITTYPRTDSLQLSKSFIDNTRAYIKKVYGEKYLGPERLRFNNDSLSQGAHEAIRPVEISLTPQEYEKKLKAEGKLKGRQLDNSVKMYNLIWTETIAVLMEPPTFRITKYRFRISDKDQVYKFYTTNETTIFDGYEIVFNQQREVNLEYLKIGDKLKVAQGPDVKYHETQTFPYFNQGSLVKALKEEGIGRPSTYVATIEKNIERMYVMNKNSLPKEQQDELRPSELGINTINVLNEYLSKYVSKEFTKNMEEGLDLIENGKVQYQAWLENIYLEFQESLKEANEKLKKTPEKVVEGEVCPQCGKALYYKRGKNGPFIGCSGWTPNKKGCNFIKSDNTNPSLANVETELDETCPICNAKLVRVTQPNGNSFVGCSNFKNKEKKCSYYKPELVGRKCPKCGKDLIYCTFRKSRFIGCSGFVKGSKNSCNYQEKIPKNATKN